MGDTFTVKKEYWKQADGKTVTKIVARYSDGDKKGQIFTQQTIKRNEPVAEYKRRFRTTQSFNQNVKDVFVYSTGVRKIISSQPIRKKNVTQVGCTLLIKKKYGRTFVEFKGFSNRNVPTLTGQQQAYGNAVKQATASGFIKYDEIAQADVRASYYYIAYV